MAVDSIRLLKTHVGGGFEVLCLIDINASAVHIPAADLLVEFIRLQAT